MAQLNANTPYIKLYVRNSFLFQDETRVDFTEGYMFGVKSQVNRPLMFHVQLNNGAIFWSVPITALQWHDEHIVVPPLHYLHIWDCQSNDLAVTRFGFLENKNVDVRTVDYTWMSGKYLFTIDNYEGDHNYLNVGYSGHPDAKVYHVIQLDSGFYGVYPNNHLRWHNKDFIKPYDLKNPPRYRPFQESLSSEHIKYSAAESEELFYKYEKTD
jgi:hypothetical protein